MTSVLAVRFVLEWLSEIAFWFGSYERGGRELFLQCDVSGLERLDGDGCQLNLAVDVGSVLWRYRSLAGKIASCGRRRGLVRWTGLH